MSKPIKTRFAPSPTGYLHVGNLRTLLYSYLFARQNNGQLLFRIEDTDQKRYIEDAEKNLIDTVTWAGITFDEGVTAAGENGPYRQSERTDIYQAHAKILLDKESAYHCFCTENRLEELRQKQEASKQPTGYDGYCRSLTPQEVELKMSSGEPSVVRLKVPKDELIIFEDIVRGKVKFASNTIDDQVLLKSDGYPTYHLANVVDDHLMGITHVIRGEEWLPSTPKHILLYQAFDWETPTFAHLPLLLNEDRSKLSKRQGDVAVEDYIEKGYSREALLNFIAFLGWNPGGTKEVFSIEELIESFDINKVQKAGAIFNLEKLNWFNWVWKQRFLKEFAESQNLKMNCEETKRGYKIDILNDEDRYTFAFRMLEDIREHISEKEEKDEHFLLRAIYANKDKILQDPAKADEFLACYFEEFEYDKSLLINEKMNVDIASAKDALAESLAALESLDGWSEHSIKESLMSVIEKLQLKNGQVLWPVRVALTGSQFSPGAFESAWVLGKEKSLVRFSTALAKLD